MKFLFVAEKPSLMKDVESCYKNHTQEIIKNVGQIEFTALSGHVCTNFEPSDYSKWDDNWDSISYPMIPKKWEIKPIDDKYKKKTIYDIKQTINNYDGIIVGTDSDTEGYGIYYLLEHYLHIENKYALRFIEHSLTDKEILKSLLNMTDFHKDPVHINNSMSFLVRSRADWLYGMNATRCASVQFGELMTIGRVKAPTIKLVYDNSKAIDDFVPHNYYTIDAKYDGEDYSFTGQYTEDGKTAKQFISQNDIPQIPLTGQVKDIKKKEIKTHAPKLFDLTSIQAEAGARFKYRPDKTLEIIQSLYEKHKLISYPRTQCRYVSSEKALEFEEMLDVIGSYDDLAQYVVKITPEAINRVLNDKMVVNDKEVQKESHDALLPTSNKPKFNKMTEEEINICHMIYTRLLAQFLPHLVEEKTVMLIDHNSYSFLCKGNVIKEIGWRALYSATKENTLPNLEINESITATEINSTKRQTKPPKRLNEATLINAMEHIDSQISDPELKKSLAESKGIGTPATRAAIIADIINRGYVSREKDGLHISSQGVRYIESIKNLEIISPIFAARLDTKIKRIQHGEANYDDVFREVIAGTTKMVQQIENMERQMPSIECQCPYCKQNLEIQRYAYICPSCKLKINKSILGQTITEKMVKELCEGKKTKLMTFTKNDGKTFKGRLKLGSSGIEFDFSSDIKCPFCNNDLKINKGGAFCDCGLKVFRNLAGHYFDDKELKKLIKYKRLKDIAFTSKNNKEFIADVVINENKEIKFEF